MTQHNFPINSIVTCTYHSTTSSKSPYQLTAHVIALNIWKILQGGWNHLVIGSYCIPHASDTAYTNFQIYTDLTTFPHPELLI